MATIAEIRFTSPMFQFGDAASINLGVAMLLALTTLFQEVILSKDPLFKSLGVQSIVGRFVQKVAACWPVPLPISNTVAFIESSCFKTSKIAFLLLSAACVFLQSRLSGRSGLLDIKFFHPKYKNQDSTKETKKRTNYAGRTWKINELEERKRE